MTFIIVIYLLTTFWEQAQNLLSEENYNILQGSVLNMQEALEDALAIANDDLARDLIPLVRRTEQSHGLGGRPWVEIDMNWLAHASQGWTLKEITKELGCSPRTVR
jgi:hypothetical protein